MTKLVHGAEDWEVVPAGRGDVSPCAGKNGGCLVAVARSSIRDGVGVAALARLTPSDGAVR